MANLSILKKLRIKEVKNFAYLKEEVDLIYKLSEEASVEEVVEKIVQLREAIESIYSLVKKILKTEVTTKESDCELWLHEGKYYKGYQINKVFKINKKVEAICTDGVYAEEHLSEIYHTLNRWVKENRKLRNTDKKELYNLVFATEIRMRRLDEDMVRLVHL